MLAWIETAILTGYGLILTASGLLIHTSVITVAAPADRLGPEMARVPLGPLVPDLGHPRLPGAMAVAAG